MSTPFTTYSFPLSSVQANATTNRTYPTRATEVLNVKDFGATGNGTTDDTLAIQNCFDAAFGTWAVPNGGIGNAFGPGPTANKAVYFPAGNYNVNPTISGRVVSGAVNSGGQIQLTVSTASLSTSDIVTISGVGGTTEANSTWFIQVDDATHLTLLGSVFTNAFTSNGALATPALRLRAVTGGLIMGAGRLSTSINCATSNCCTIATDGFSYSTVKDLTFKGNGTGTGGTTFLLSKQTDGSPPNFQCNAQQNAFLNCFFGDADYGLTQGLHSSMGSDTVYEGCFFANCSAAGLATFNQNALDHTVLGGNFQNCGTGVRAVAEIIHGVSFQGQTTADIVFVTGGSDSFSVAGCRTESLNFCLNQDSGTTVCISGCSQHSSAAGYFYEDNGAGYVTILGCFSDNGYIDGNPRLTIMNSVFQSTGYLTAGLENFCYLNVTPQPILTITSTNFPLPSYAGSQKLVFTSSTGCLIPLNKNSNAANALGAGSFVDVQSLSSSTITFSSTAGVTITSRSSLRSLNGYGAVGRLVCDGTDTWTLSGDLV